MAKRSRKNISKVIAIIASLVLAFGLVPVTASAAGEGPDGAGSQAPDAPQTVVAAGPEAPPLSPGKADDDAAGGGKAVEGDGKAGAGAPDGKSEETDDAKAGAPAEGAGEGATETAPVGAGAAGGGKAEAPAEGAGEGAPGAAPADAGGAENQSGPAGQADKPGNPEQAAPAAEDGAAAANAQAAQTAAEPVGDKAQLPAFRQSRTVGDVTVTVEADAGAFPEGAGLSVAGVPSSRTEAAVAPERGAGENVAVSYTFDIKVLGEDGAELQPANGKSVRVSFKAAEVADPNLDVSVYHVSGGSAEELAVSESGASATATSGGFSYYTVEFTYGNLQYVLPGGKSVPLADVLAAVGLQGEPEAAESSNPGLFAVEKGDGVWTVAARKAFHTEETLTVTINGTDYTIEVTDDDGSTGYDLINGILPADGGYVWMGGESPVKWHVIGKNDSNWLLISSDLIGGSSNTMKWHISNYNCRKMLSGFSEAEQAAVPATTKSEPEDYQYESKFGYFGRSPVNAKMFLLSAEEAETYFSSDAARQPGLWWLRSPGYNNDNIAGAVYGDGRVISYTGVHNDLIFGARPAFQLNLSSVLFSSAAEGGKSSAAAGSGEFGTINKTSGDGDNEIKLTLTDGARSGFSANAETSAASPGGTLDVSYSGVTTGDYVSVLLCDASGEILNYASKTPEASGEGTWSMTIPAGLAKGSYTLKVFSEQQNGDKKTDYASPVSEIALTVEAVPDEYDITFVNYDGTMLQSGKVAKGKTPEYIGDEPVRTATAQYEYVFAGWEPEVEPVKSGATYTAKYEEVPRLYTVAWLNDDGTEFYRDVKVPYGTMPKFEGATPTKPSDDKYAYEFAGWEPKLTDVTGDAAYTAKYKATPVPAKPSYRATSGEGSAYVEGSGAPMVFTFVRSVNPETAFAHFTGIEVDGKAVPQKDASGKDNWTARSGSVIVELQPSYLATLPAGAHTVAALFDDGDPAVADFKVSPAPAPATHTVAFDANGHGKAPDAQTVEHGEKAKRPANPTADGYTFGGWYKDEACKEAYDFSKPVTADLTLYAKWTRKSSSGSGTSPKTGDPLAGAFAVALALAAASALALAASRRMRRG